MDFNDFPTPVGGGDSGGGAAGFEFIENITANKTFDASGYSSLIVIVCGGGGRSPDTGIADTTMSVGGAGGGGSVRGLITSPETEYVCTIGSGASSANTSGGTTSFGTAISCTGGSPGGSPANMRNYNPPSQSGLNGTVTLGASVTQLAIGDTCADEGHKNHGGRGGSTLLAGGGIGGRTGGVTAGTHGSGGGGPAGYGNSSANGGAGIIQVWGKV